MMNKMDKRMIEERKTFYLGFLCHVEAELAVASRDDKHWIHHLCRKASPPYLYW